MDSVLISAQVKKYLSPSLKGCSLLQETKLLTV